MSEIWSLDGEIRKAKARGLDDRGTDTPPPPPVPVPDAEVLLASLASVLCPACGEAKQPMDSLCYGCWRGLDRLARSHLSRIIGHGYEEAMGDALASLRVTGPHWPAGGSS